MDDEELRERMTELARTFPYLGRAWGEAPLQPDELNRWAASIVSTGERATASFILSVWDASTDWEAGRFNVMEALRVWPLDYRAAFLNWASEP